jgi:glycosyl transferase family 87
MARPFGSFARFVPYLIGAFGLAVLGLAAVGFTGSSGFAYDFAAYDLAARRLAQGDPLYPPGVAEAYNAGAYANLYLYAPPLAVALIPMSVLPPSTAAAVWLIVRMGLLAVGCAIMPIRRELRIATFGIAGLSFPVLYDLNLGNLSIIVFALSVVIWRERDRRLASVALAATLTVRYGFAIVLVGWLVRRRLRTILATIAAGIVIGLATLPIVGVGGWLDYMTNLGSLRDISTGPHNLTLGSTGLAFGVPPELRPLLVLGGIGLALAVTVFAGLRRDAETAVVVSLAAAVLFAPFFHPHYLVGLLIPAAFLAGRGYWWGLILPLLGWLPGEFLPLVATAGMALPLVARHATTPDGPDQPAATSLSRTERAPSS